MTVSAGETIPVEVPLVPRRSVRIALVHGRERRTRDTLMRAALGAGVEVGVVAHAADGRAFAELAQAFREAAPASVVIAGDHKDVRAIAIILEALRYGCAAQEPRAHVLFVGDPRSAERLRAAARPFALDVVPDERAAVAALRAIARDAAVPSRDEIIEDAARALAASTAADALVVDVSDGSTSCVLARADGVLSAAHVTPLGIGEAADRVLQQVGVDRIRRWIPWPIDAPALIERVYNRARWGAAVPAGNLALAIDMALAREAIACALAAASDAGLDAAAMRHVPSILVTGRAASFPRAAQTMLVAVDALEPTGLVSIWREPDEGGAQRVGAVASVWPRRSANVRVIQAAGRREHRVRRGSFVLAAASGDVAVRGPAVRGTSNAGAVGVLIDARGRPLRLPHRDAERLPAIGAWYSAIGALAASAKT